MSKRTRDDDVLHIAAFSGIVRAFHDAQVPYIAKGTWCREENMWSRPRWEGSFVVPGQPDAILQMMAALATLDYEPLTAVDPRSYVDPDYLLDSHQALDEAQPAEIDRFEFATRDSEASPVGVHVASADAFARDFEASRVEMLEPDLVVRLPDVGWRDFVAEQRGGDHRCLQSAYDVAVQEDLWRLFTGAVQRLGRFPRPPAPGLMWFWYSPPSLGDDSPSDRRDGRPSFGLFTSVVEALNAAGVSFLAEGLWNRRHFDWGPPAWDGSMRVLCDEDNVQRLLIGFASIGFAPRSPVDPQIYADPRNLWRDDDDLEDDPSTILFVPAAPDSSEDSDSSEALDSSQASDSTEGSDSIEDSDSTEGSDSTEDSVEVLVLSPQEFGDDLEEAVDDECAPDVPVRILDYTFTQTELEERICPQKLQDVAALSATWMQELVPEGHPMDDALERSLASGATPCPQPETGVSLPRLRRLACALSNVGACYTFVGHWEHNRLEDPPLFWKGHLEIPLRSADVHNVFAALASAGYLPQVAISAQGFLDQQKRTSGPDDDGTSDGTNRGEMLTFIDPSPGWARLIVVGREWSVFRQRHDQASFEEVAPGVLVAMNNFELMLPIRDRGCPQQLRDVVAFDAAMRNVDTDDGGTTGAAAHPNETALLAVPSKRRRFGLSVGQYEQLAEALHRADARWVLNGGWLVDPDSEATILWTGLVVIPREVAAATSAFTGFASIGYEPQPPMSPQHFASLTPLPRWIDEIFRRDSTPRLAFVNSEHPTTAIQLVTVELARFERLAAGAAVEEVAPGVPVSARNPVREGLCQSRTPQCLGEVRKLLQALESGFREVLAKEWRKWDEEIARAAEE